MIVTIIGTGYVGLISGVCLASQGHEIICIDTNPKIIEKLNIGIPHIHEKGLEELLNKVIRKGLFRASLDLNEALDVSEVIIIAVGTPSFNGTINLQYIKNLLYYKYLYVITWLDKKKDISHNYKLNSSIIFFLL